MEKKLIVKGRRFAGLASAKLEPDCPSTPAPAAASLSAECTPLSTATCCEGFSSFESLPVLQKRRTGARLVTCTEEACTQVPVEGGGGELICCCSPGTRECLFLCFCGANLSLRQWNVLVSIVCQQRPLAVALSCRPAAERALGILDLQRRNPDSNDCIHSISAIEGGTPSCRSRLSSLPQLKTSELPLSSGYFSESHATYFWIFPSNTAEACKRLPGRLAPSCTALRKS